MNTKTRTYLFSFVGIATLLIVVVLLFVSSRQTEQVAFFARDINDASYDCEDKIASKFGRRLINKYYDDLSSRYQANDKQYLIYYRVSVKDDEQLPTTSDYMVKCVVWEKLGYVSDFEVFDP